MKHLRNYTTLAQDVIYSNGVIYNYQRNSIFNMIIIKCRHKYSHCQIHQKAAISQVIVHVVMSCEPRGRFLDFDYEGKCVEISNDKAIEMTCKLLNNQENRTSGDGKEDTNTINGDVYSNTLISDDKIILKKKLKDIETYISWDPRLKHLKKASKELNLSITTNNEQPREPNTIE